MATVSKGRTFVSGETVTPAKLNELVDNATVSGIVNADIDASAAIALSKLATGALPTAITVASANLVDGTIVNADINASAAIAGSKLADGGITAAKLDGAQTGSAPIFGCRAWVNFNGTTTPPSIRASGNVTSVTKNGTGDFTITFTTALPDANFSAVATTNLGNNLVVVGDVGTHVQSKSTTAYRMVVRYVNFPGANVPLTDPETVCVQIFR